ncbi:Phospho-2-dehydro-3-deoxyheptonate aldolase,phenylalanine-inhibited [Lachnellula suecica]|uniref:Phospho-2-dehydro-3-deoxyheptonate aldolase,phenylalanine-inhibited n=1 Tax=Lachnellula suecica TaxID=602035 RepID=A0A8T9BZ29_9HELO|nr:Phospho-2-dehydro-3-deoxyheptonate aldolase,phenylalanine-inhibited [Lachnellula suecica]
MSAVNYYPLRKQLFCKETNSIPQSYHIENPNVGNKADTEDWRIRGYNPLTPPDLLQHEIPQTPTSKATVIAGRNESVAVVNGTDPLGRLLVVIGPAPSTTPPPPLYTAANSSRSRNNTRKTYSL